MVEARVPRILENLCTTFFQRALISSKLENLSCRIVLHGHKMDSRIVFGSESATGSFAPGSRAEVRLRTADAGAKGITTRRVRVL